MARIFLPLAALSLLFLVVAMSLGLMIEDPKVPTATVQSLVQYHFLSAVGAACLRDIRPRNCIDVFHGDWAMDRRNLFRLSP